MKTLKSISIFLTVSASISFAQAAAQYDLTITNGSLMPISPAAIYVKSGGDSLAAVGTVASSGLVLLCQTGNAINRITELKANADVKFVTQTTGPILPGESLTVTVDVENPKQQSIHFEAMYGKTKDACAVGSVNSHTLTALSQHVTPEFIGRDNAVLTGAFNPPALPAGMTYLDNSVCASATNAVNCLRELSTPAPADGKIHYFSDYFPSLVSALETKYGSADVQTLLFSSSGAVKLKLKLKH